jgi:1-acyl-sn-glycerol-3-phosphate acyltransferase
MFQKFLYFFCKNFVYLALKCLWRLEMHGLENIPREGGVLLASNHVSLMDPPVVGCCMPRDIFFFAKEELFRYFGFGWLIRHLNAFPVRRFEHDIGAFKHAQRLLENGKALILFPEGHRSKTGELGKPKAGAGMLACKAQVPVVPIYVENTRYIKQFKKIRVYCGPCLFMPKEAMESRNYQAFSEQIMAAIAELKFKRYNE